MSPTEAAVRSIQDAPSASQPEMLECFNPATGAKLGEIRITTPAEVDVMLDRARAAQVGWAALSYAERGKYLLKLRAVIAQQTDQIVDIICQDNGKVRTDAIGEVFASCDFLTYYAKKAGKILRDTPIPVGAMLHKKAFRTYFPMGVAGIISPWNYPLVLAIGPASAALAAGNTVILKPSEVTSWVGKKIKEMFDAAGFPKDVVQTAFGDGRTGAALAGSTKVNKICFTGSVATGKKIAEVCARNLTPVTLELGGKDPFVVLPDADIERAANGAVWGAFTNSGQVCQSVERVYVHKSIAKPFTDKVIEKTKQLRLGTYDQGEVDVGSMTFPKQVGIVEDHIQDAVAKGAKIELGGKRTGKGLFFEPTVLTNVNHGMKIMRDETFGPVLPIMVVDSEQEAIRLANDSQYGLCGSVWTSDKRHGIEVAHQLHAGAINLNDTMINFAIADAPFGGVKESGIGHTHGPEGLKAFTHCRVVTANRLGGKREMTWYPYSPKLVNSMTKLIRFLFGKA